MAISAIGVVGQNVTINLNKSEHGRVKEPCTAVNVMAITKKPRNAVRKATLGPTMIHN